ncbi:2-amino-4-hydroxy-6-hydroxymethyldihydropteridine diphosphokinase [Wenyingzhuangia sp. IMCC45533]
MNTAILSLGTNLGNKLENLNNALSKIKGIGNILKVSSIYQTPPWGFESDDFYNISIQIETSLNTSELLTELLTFEEELGRLRNENLEGYQARPLDIDILFFNNDIINTPHLEIPHPRIQDRKFVLIPTIEIVKNFTHPVLKDTLENLLAKTNDDSDITRLDIQLTL